MNGDVWYYPLRGLMDVVWYVGYCDATWRKLENVFGACGVFKVGEF